jgi:hypothetical protein
VSGAPRDKSVDPSVPATIVEEVNVTPELIAASLLDYLACKLYETMEHLDPSDGGYIDWRDLPPRDHEFYVLCILQLCCEAKRFQQLADYDLVSGHIKTGEQFDSNNQI